MYDLKNMYKLQNWVINPLVLKNIKKLNLDLNEFLLILFFLNVSPSLDLEKIKNELGLNEEEILNSFSSLITKGIIETVVTKENGKVSESISLEMFYDKLILQSKEPKTITPNNDIFSKFENEFGRSLSPMEYETINNWLSKGVKEETITSALREAVISNALNLRYIDKIIYEWTKKQVKNDSRPNNDEEFVPLFDCDWIGRMDTSDEEKQDYYR